MFNGAATMPKANAPGADKVRFSISTGLGVTNKPWQVGRRRFKTKAQALAFASGDKNWRLAR